MTGVSFVSGRVSRSAAARRLNGAPPPKEAVDDEAFSCELVGDDAPRRLLHDRIRLALVARERSRGG
jgi:hypothetical protein